MDSIIEISARVGFKHPEEIIKTLRIGNVGCDVEVDRILKSPVLPPLSYTDDCMRFITLLKYWKGKYVAKECAKAYRRVIRRSLKEKEEFWWCIQELLYRVKADVRVIRRYLRRLKRNYRRILKSRERIEEITAVWILPPYIEIFAGLLPPRVAVRVVKFAIDSLIQKSDYFARFNVSIFDLVFKLFDGLYKIALTNSLPKDKLRMMIDFVRFYIGMVEISLICGENSVDPFFDLSSRKNSD